MLEYHHSADLTSMDQPTFSMKIVKRQENLSKSSLQQRRREAMCLIAIQEVGKAIPHGSLDQTQMIATFALDGELRKSCSHVSVTWM